MEYALLNLNPHKMVEYLGQSIQEWTEENFWNPFKLFKDYLCYKTIFCHKVALDVQLMNFFYLK